MLESHCDSADRSVMSTNFAKADGLSSDLTQLFIPVWPISFVKISLLPWQERSLNT